LPYDLLRANFASPNDLFGCAICSTRYSNRLNKGESGRIHVQKLLMMRRVVDHGNIPIRVSPRGKWVGKEKRKHVRLPEQVGD
jgi:hypothetical protein